MHSHRIFENPPALPHGVVVEALEPALRDRSAAGEAAEVLVGTALNDDDAEFVERRCVQAGTRAVPGSPLLGPAGLCLARVVAPAAAVGRSGCALLAAQT
ncbi:hypothetical protein AB0D11_08720 [Streptomyces monashensis]|uniref:hypothetical protein n=1 Tax=Streptomyces monashensis TaxID=1678012 RepID=UPI0033E09656